jgi:2-keto-4-pentenoate hydratase/2-oxohepta-3-ene-1,7-dioic acid hydratase in catechol pathway
VVSEKTDWEAELVVVIGAGGRNIPLDRALDAVAGYTVGQDISDRILQMEGPHAQYSMGKSFENFGPVGPWITTLDEIGEPEDLAISCAVSGVLFQDSRTSDMVFRVSELVSYLSTVVQLRPGDLLFTGSPHGVGQGQQPPRFLRAGDTIETTIEGLGVLHCEVVHAAS